MRLFANRSEAGRELASALRPRFAGASDVLVLGLPRGGVPVAYEIAVALDAPLDVFIVRKLGVPGHEELAMGAIASGGVRVLNDDVVHSLGLGAGDIETVARQEAAELERREATYRYGRPPLQVSDRRVVVVDDGLATGSTMLAAVEALRKLQPQSIVVAIPLAPESACARLRRAADMVVCLNTPEPFWGVGMWYEEFEQTTDDEVVGLIERANRRAPRHRSEGVADAEI